MDAETTRERIVAAAPLGGTVDSLRAHALALMFAAGAILALSTLVFPGADSVDTVPWAINASLGLPVAAVLWRWGHRFADPVFHIVLATGAVIVSVGMTFGNGGSLTVAASFFFIWVALYTFLFFEWRAAAAHVVLDAGMLVSALTISGVDAAAAVALLVIGTSVIVGTVTGTTRAQLARLATIDQLTGLANRRRLHDALVAETARSTRTGTPYSIALIDFDGFKAVNDTRGHHAGDQLLITSARAWQACLRPTDLLVRFGGDEFVAVLPECDAVEAESIANRLHEAATGTCSIGVATWKPEQERDEVLRRADHNLYTSKRNGGSRVTTERD